MAAPLDLPASWRAPLADELGKPYLAELLAFVAAERAAHQVFPPEAETLAALEATPFDQVGVVILGQDPYHDVGQAHGLCFSVRRGVKVPPSLANIYKELASDVSVTPPKHGSLEAWAARGVLLLNAVLTVRAHAPGSHANKGWEAFTDAILRALSAREQHTVFVLWGAYAKKKAPLCDAAPGRHTVITGVHPSPLSAKSGFFGSKPFSRVNEARTQRGQPAIDWRLPA